MAMYQIFEEQCPIREVIDLESLFVFSCDIEGGKSLGELFQERCNFKNRRGFSFFKVFLVPETQKIIFLCNKKE